MKQVTAILLGAGARGAKVYAPYSKDFPHELKFVGVAEPQTARRDKFAQEYEIDSDFAVENWEDLLARPKFADAVIVCTQDRMHFAPALKALQQGYHVMLEKPMSPFLEECLLLEEAAAENDRLLIVCHVLRYTSFWSQIKKIIDSGEIGDIVNIQLNENIGYHHIAHSYVRGNWRDSDLSSPIILAKSCHDMDMISWLSGQACKRVSSFGSLMHFHAGNAPEGATDRCTDGCPVESQCPYYAPRYYLGEHRYPWAAHFTEQLDNESIMQGLRESSYGRCVYKSDNNVVDHQVVNMEFDNGATASFCLSGFTHDTSRHVQIMGTKGEIRGVMERNSFTVYDFLTKQETEIRVHVNAVDHGGGDEGLIRSFVREVAHYYDGQSSITSAGSTIQGHLMAFAAELSRLEHGRTIELESLYR